MDEGHQFRRKVMTPYLLPEEASNTMHTAFVEAVGKQANEHDNK